MKRNVKVANKGAWLWRAPRQKRLLHRTAPSFIYLLNQTFFCTVWADGGHTVWTNRHDPCPLEMCALVEDQAFPTKPSNVWSQRRQLLADWSKLSQKERREPDLARSQRNCLWASGRGSERQRQGYWGVRKSPHRHGTNSLDTAEKQHKQTVGTMSHHLGWEWVSPDFGDRGRLPLERKIKPEKQPCLCSSMCEGIQRAWRSF